MLNFKYCFSFLSVFIADYIYLFPDAKTIFEEQTQALAGLHQSAVAEVVGGGTEVVAGAQSAAVVQRSAADQGNLLPLDQRTI